MHLTLSKDILDILLFDRTIERNLIFAENTEFCNYNDELTYERITEQPIVISEQYKRVQGLKKKDAKKAIVYTPQFSANNMIELLDIERIGLKTTEDLCAETFPINETDQREFLIDKVSLDEEQLRSYISFKSLENCCGEGPFLVQRYHLYNGELIDLSFRKGMLDRKLHVIKRSFEKGKSIEKTDISRFFSLAIDAYKSTYGYDLLGRQVFISRKNLYFTFIEFYEWAFKETPSIDKLKTIANIISHNIFQMNGLTFEHPIRCEEPIYVKVTDWVKGKELLYKDLTKAS